MVRPTIFKDELDIINQYDKLEPSDDETRKDYLKFRLDITKQAILSLRQRIPIKILQFNKLMNVNAVPGTLLNTSDLKTNTFHEQTEDNTQTSTTANTPNVSSSDSEQPNQYKKLKENTQKRPFNETIITHTPTQLSEGIIVGGMIDHKKICEELEKVKCEAAELIEMIGNIKLWIQLNVPRIEDGNNFGVSIQEEAIQELARVEDSAFNLFDSILKYYMARAKISSKIIKYPTVNDYKEAVRELDEKEWLHIKITMVDMRNNYSMLYDLLSKNWEKVVKPKNEDSGHRMVF